MFFNTRWQHWTDLLESHSYFYQVRCSNSKDFDCLRMLIRQSKNVYWERHRCCVCCQNQSYYFIFGKNRRRLKRKNPQENEKERKYNGMFSVGFQIVGLFTLMVMGPQSLSLSTVIGLGSIHFDYSRPANL
jgi:hypothetical protein